MSGKEKKKQKEKIKVVDKRRFSQDSDASAADGPASGKGGEGENEFAGSGPQESDRPYGEFPNKMDFVTFILSMSQTALLNLGCGPHPDTGKCDCDLGSAKCTIDIIEVLQEKTKGNLTGEEERILDRILTELRLMWVKKSREMGGRKQ